MTKNSMWTVRITEEVKSRFVVDLLHSNRSATRMRTFHNHDDAHEYAAKAAAQLKTGKSLTIATRTTEKRSGRVVTTADGFFTVLVDTSEGLRPVAIGMDSIRHAIRKLNLITGKTLAGNRQATDQVEVRISGKRHAIVRVGTRVVSYAPGSNESTAVLTAASPVEANNAVRVVANAMARTPVGRQHYMAVGQNVVAIDGNSHEATLAGEYLSKRQAKFAARDMQNPEKTVDMMAARLAAHFNN